MLKKATSALWWTLIAALYAICIWVLFIGPHHEAETRRLPAVEFPTYYLIEGNTIQPMSNPVYIKPQVLGVMVEEELDYDQAELLLKLEDCENPHGERCNLECGCDCGMGPWMLIPSTVRYCEKVLGKSIDPFVREEARECAAWLLENEGPHHWGYPPWDERGWKNGKRWGTWECWSPYLSQ